MSGHRSLARTCPKMPSHSAGAPAALGPAMLSNSSCAREAPAAACASSRGGGAVESESIMTHPGGGREGLGRKAHKHRTCGLNGTGVTDAAPLRTGVPG